MSAEILLEPPWCTRARTESASRARAESCTPSSDSLATRSAVMALLGGIFWYSLRCSSIQFTMLSIRLFSGPFSRDW